MIMWGLKDHKLPVPHMSPYSEVEFKRVQEVVESNQKEFTTSMARFNL